MKLSINNRVLWFYFDTKLRIYGVSLFGAGVGITTTNFDPTDPNLHYGMSGGTCPATQFVSGTIGLMLSKNSKLSLEDVRRIIVNSSDPTIGFPPEYPTGRINAYQALLATPEEPHGTGKFLIDIRRPHREQEDNYY